MIWDDDGLAIVFGDSIFRISQTAILALLAGATILLFLAFLYFQFLVPGKGRKCRWRRARDGDAGPQLSSWRCETCQVEAYSSDNRPPKECKKTLKSGL